MLPKFLIGYNATVHSTTSMPPDEVKDSDVLAIWQRMNETRSRVSATRPIFNVGQQVRISKEK
jgi:hypothetical protein